MKARNPWKACACVVLAMTAGACASGGGVPRPFPLPGPRSSSGRTETTSSRPADARPFDGYALAGTALGLRGAPYRNGGGDPSGFDCSGFTQYVFAQYGVALPRAVRDQYRLGQSVQSSDLVPGDLLFFATTSPDVSHVAVAIGGDEFVHAPSSSGVVRVEHLRANYWAQRFLGARRLN